MSNTSKAIYTTAIILGVALVVLLGLAWSGALIDDEGKDALISWLNNTNANAAEENQILIQKNEQLTDELTGLRDASTPEDNSHLKEENQSLLQRNRELESTINRLREQNGDLANSTTPRLDTRTPLSRDEVLDIMRDRRTHRYDELVTAISYDVNRISIPAKLLIGSSRRQRLDTLVIARITLSQNAAEPHQRIRCWGESEDLRDGRTITIMDPELLLYDEMREAILDVLDVAMELDDWQYDDRSIERINYVIEFNRLSNGQRHVNSEGKVSFVLRQDLHADGHANDDSGGDRAIAWGHYNPDTYPD